MSRQEIYEPNTKMPFRISRSKIDLYLECPCCFYLDRKLGVRRPDMPAFSLNSVVDQLLKKEFDILRKNGQVHELMKKYNIDLVPFKHPDLPIWRDDAYRYVGACVLHKPTNLEICGIIDDLWVDSKGELSIVDYKSTSTDKEISLDDKYKQGYKLQMEVYQWIFRRLGFKVSNTGYFVFANASKESEKFDGKLVFDLSIIEHNGDDSWVEPTIFEIHKVLNSDQVPSANEACKYCNYRQEVDQAAKKLKREKVPLKT